MASNKYLLTVKLTTQGGMKIANTKKSGFSTGMECHGFNYEVMAPYDHQTGAMAGKRTHRPITIRKEVDAASPMLFQALVTNEVFKSATLEVSSPSPGGRPAYTIELTQGRIIKIKPVTNSGAKPCEGVTLAYEDLLVNGVPCGVIPSPCLS
jgi:type VI secretion system secreted protein Hcp